MPPVRSSDNTFCIAVLGDFLGEGSGALPSAEVAWDPRRATPDTVFGLTGLRPRIRVSIGNRENTEEVEFAGLDSFEPRDLFRRLEVFAPLRAAREAAKKGGSASDLTTSGGEPFSESSAEGLPPGPNSAPGGDLLGAILDQTEIGQKGDAPPDPGRPGTKEELDAFVREAVRPHLIQTDDDGPDRVAAVDEEASRLMSSLLHHRPIQRLESLWRSLVTLLSRVDTTGKVRVYLVHLPRAELEWDLSGAAGPLHTKLHGLLARPELGVPGRRWAVAVGAHELLGGPADIRLLQKIAGVAQAADVPWISSIQLADPRPSGEGERTFPGESQELSEEWTRFRELPEAAWIGLTYPRFLVREPYGSHTRHSKVFDFKERATERDHLLWGEGAFLCAALLAQSFAESEWGFRPETHLDLGGMPLAASGDGSGDPPTSVERNLSPPQAEALARSGLMPLLGSPGRAGIRVGGFRSVAPGESSFGPWRRS